MRIFHDSVVIPVGPDDQQRVNVGAGDVIVTPISRAVEVEPIRRSAPEPASSVEIVERDREV